MALPWVRLDANIATHDKILGLLNEKPATVAYQAAFSYVCALGYAGGHGTDGLISFGTLPFVHGTRKTAELLVQHFLWEPDPQGWRIHNFETRQQSAATSQAIKNAQRAGAKRANCTRWHTPGCKCWEGVA